MFYEFSFYPHFTFLSIECTFNLYIYLINYYLYLNFNENILNALTKIVHLNLLDDYKN